MQTSGTESNQDESDGEASVDTSLDHSSDERRSPPPYVHVLHSFRDGLNAYRDLGENLEEGVRELDDAMRVGTTFAKSVPPERRDAFLSRWSEVVEGLSEDRIVNRSSSSKELGDLAERLRESGEYEDFLASICLGHALTRPPRSIYLYQSLLVAAVGQLDALIASLIRSFYESKPEALDAKELRFSLADVDSFDSLDDARRVIVEGKVGKWMAKSLSGQGDWFKQHKIADFEEVAMDFDRLREIIQRRHLIVHNDSVVNQRYLDALPDQDTPPPIGVRLATWPGYVRRAIDDLMAFGAGLVGLTWAKDEPDTAEQMSYEVLDRVIFQEMLSANWAVVEHLCSIYLPYAGSGDVAYSIRCNRWHARKMLRGLTAIESEVRAWDTSALKAKYQLVRLVLLGDFDAALDRLPRLHESGELGVGEIMEWPILEPMRAHSRFEEIAVALLEGLEADSDG